MQDSTGAQTFGPAGLSGAAALQVSDGDLEMVVTWLVDECGVCRRPSTHLHIWQSSYMVVAL